MDPIKLHYILERAASDEAIDQAQRLQAGELSAAEAEAMRTSPDEQVRALYELYRPLDEIEQQRLLRGSRRAGRRVWQGVGASLAAAASIAVVAVPRLLQPGAVVVRLDAMDTSQADKDGVQHLDGRPGQPGQGPMPLTLPGCAHAILKPPLHQEKLSPGGRQRAFFVQGDAVVEWTDPMRYHTVSGTFSHEHCAPLPVAGLHPGPAQLVVFSGYWLPDGTEVASLLRKEERPRWSLWTRTAPLPVVFRSATNPTGD